MMRKNQNVRIWIEKMAIKVATADANAACPCVTYQPSVPRAMKKLRKD